jgi:hypothetical protein
VNELALLRVAVATSIVRIPTQLSRMRQVLSDSAPRNGVSPRPSILSATATEPRLCSDVEACRRQGLDQGLPTGAEHISANFTWRRENPLLSPILWSTPRPSLR